MLWSQGLVTVQHRRVHNSLPPPEPRGYHPLIPHQDRPNVLERQRVVAAAIEDTSSDYSIEDSFVHQVSAQLTPGRAAVYALVRSVANRDQVVSEV